MPELEPRLRWTPVNDLPPAAREALDRYPEARWFGPVVVNGETGPGPPQEVMQRLGGVANAVGGCVLAGCLLWLLPWIGAAAVGLLTGDWEAVIVGVVVLLVFVGLPLFFLNRMSGGAVGRWIEGRVASRRLGQVTLRMESTEHRRGDDLVFFLRFTPRRALRVNVVRATVTADDRSLTAALDRGREIDRGDDTVVAGRFPLPADWPPSPNDGSAGQTAHWTLTVFVDVDDWPDYERTAPLVVR